VADVWAGHLWYFPPGIPHSIQGLPPEGCEFLLAFPNGGFSEDSTFSLTDLFSHTPKDSLARNFGVSEHTFDRIEQEELFIFQAAPPPSIAGRCRGRPANARMAGQMARQVRPTPVALRCWS
jgi:oxalate decarboxylase